jgi:hypothetical protein
VVPCVETMLASLDNMRGSVFVSRHLLFTLLSPRTRKWTSRLLRRIFCIRLTDERKYIFNYSKLSNTVLFLCMTSFMGLGLGRVVREVR